MNRTWETWVRRDQRRYTPAVHSKPVFTDPSGRRRRVMRRIGLVSAAALAICLGAVVVAMAGGPAAPFTDWAAPRAPVAAPHNGSTHPGPGSRHDEPAAIQPAAGARIVALAVRRFRAPSVWQCYAPAHRL